MTLAVALKLTPVEVRALSWDEAQAWLALLAKRDRRAAARANARKARR